VGCRWRTSTRGERRLLAGALEGAGGRAAAAPGGVGRRDSGVDERDPGFIVWATSFRRRAARRAELLSSTALERERRAEILEGTARGSAATAANPCGPCSDGQATSRSFRRPRDPSRRRRWLARANPPSPRQAWTGRAASSRSDEPPIGGRGFRRGSTRAPEIAAGPRRGRSFTT
jgi:hypothetical protein